MSLQKDLYEAIRSGNKSKILDLLQEDVDLSLTRATFGEMNNTALHLAFESVGSTEAQLIEILAIFLDRGLGINVKNEEEKTILQLAIERRMREVIDFCLSRKADPNLTSKRWSSIAHFVIKEELRKLNTCRCIKDEEKESADFIHWMLSRGVDFYYKNNSLGFSALYWANELDLEHIVFTLLKGIDDLPAAECNRTPLLYAFLKRIGHYNSRYAYDIVKLIFEKNRSMSFETIDKALSLAIHREQMGQGSFIKKLVQHGVDLKYKDDQGRTLLHHAVDNPTLIKWLLEWGADVNAKDKNGKTPLHNAMNKFVVKVLFDAGAHVDAVDHQGHTPLREVLSQKNLRLIEEMLKCGADIQDPKVFKFKLLCVDQRYRWYHFIPEYLKYLEQHLIKLILAGFLDNTLYVRKRFLEAVWENFVQQCLLEIKLLKTFFVDDCTSLYKLLHKGRNRRCAYVENEKLQALVRDTALEKKFPNYFVFILGCYNQAKTRKTFLEKSFDIFDKITKINCPYLCTDSIFEYLSNADLLCFIEAGRSLDLSC